MTTDLEQRLRERPCGVFHESLLHNEAADEIARLCAENASLRKALLWCSRHAGGEIADDAGLAELKYVPEVVRLRIEALERELAEAVAAERERCARIALKHAEPARREAKVAVDGFRYAVNSGRAMIAESIAAAIRNGGR